jgi:hypothetical protein
MQTTAKFDSDKTEIIVKCICLLHNITNDNDGILQSNTRHHSSEVPATSTACRRDNIASTRACEIREKLKKYFCNERLNRERK